MNIPISATWNTRFLKVIALFKQSLLLRFGVFGIGRIPLGVNTEP